MKQELDNFEYIYFVSYAHEKGFGNVEMISPYQYTDIKHIREIEDKLNQKYGFDSSCVLNFNLLSMREENETET